MSVVHLQTQVQRAVSAGYPSDGSKPLPRRVERLCTLIASEDQTMRAIANTLGVSHVTVWRTRKLAPVAARIRFLRERFRQEAYDATPLVDKRNRVVLAASLATTLHDEGERKEWRDVVAVTKQGVEITGFDWRRTDQVRQLLDYIAKEVGDRTPTPSGGTTVNVGISMDDAVTRVQALLSRMPDAIEGESTPVAERTANPVAPSEGGGEGS